MTNIVKYGSENFTETKLFKDKCVVSVNNKYGCDNVFKSEIIKSKIKSTNLLKYGFENVSQNSDIQKEKLKHHTKNLILRIYPTKEVMKKIL
jgi:hypothetical protein